MSETPDIEQMVWKAVAANPNLDATSLLSKLKGISRKQLADALNGLLRKDLVKASKTAAGLVWKSASKADAKIKNAMAGDERMVYSAIEAAGNQGIWSRTIQGQTNLPNTVVTKVINKLISSKQVKMVKSVKNPTRKMYMLANVEPSVELTGGPWYTDFELDPEFISTVKSACLKFIRTKSFPDPDDNTPTAALFSGTRTDIYPTVNDVTKWFRQSNISETELAPQHIEEILNVLIYDGEIEKLPAFGGPKKSTREDFSDGEGRSSKHRKSQKRRKKDHSDHDNVTTGSTKKRRDRHGSDSEEDVTSVSTKKRSKKRNRDDESEEESLEEISGPRKKKWKSGKSSEDESDTGSKKSSKRSRSESRSRSKKGYSDSDSESEDSSSATESDASSSSSRHRKRSKSKSKSKRSKRGSESSSEDEKVDFDITFGHLFDGGNVYRAIRQERVGLGWSQAPCGRCPQLEFCEDNGPVNPQGCKYYSDWLNQVMDY
ncbi:34-kDa subunit of RNA polymerase III (C) [Tulasnella sp. 419]|nr:34-kDa subunit of RNA polymerase III (C) [Tulasnella sp. 419]